MTDRILHVDYKEHSGWVRPILRSAQAHPTLAARAAAWKQSQLFDLGFAIETRLGALHELVLQIGDLMRSISEKLPAGDVLERHLSRGAAYAFRGKDIRMIRGLLVALDAFVSESRSVFENLAAFHRLFLKTFFDENIPEKKQYEAVEKFFKDPAVAERLRKLRHDIRHDRAPWLQFRVSGDPPRFEPELVLNYRPGPSGALDFARMTELAEFRFAIWHAAENLKEYLAQRVETF